MASQGMIHGGQRYTLQGKLNSHSESIASMPKIWENCLAGESEPNLNNVELLSQKQYLWSTAGLSSTVTSFFASRSMNSRVATLDKSNRPKILEDAKKVYQLDEVVIDIKSLTKALNGKFTDGIYKANQIEYKTNQGQLEQIIIDQNLELSAKQYIFCAGQGNAEIAELLAPEKKLTQLRPLKQVMVKTLEEPLYAHCITADPRPRVTVSAHPYNNGYVWYLGGLVAVQGVNQSDQETINFAYQELVKLFPQVDWQSKEWSCVLVDRAEPNTSGKLLPEGPAVKELGNCTLAWPTKLTFAPALANKILKNLKCSSSNLSVALPLEHPEITNYPWEECQWTKL